MPGEALEGDARESARQLVFRVGASVFAARIEDVVETMRPLPVAPLRDAPTFLLGVAVVRGKPTPVVDVGGLVGTAPCTAPTRYVLVRIRGRNGDRNGDRRAALAVDQVIGVLPLDAVEPLSELCGPNAAGVSASGAGGELTLLLDLVRLVPAETWAIAEGRGSD